MITGDEPINMATTDSGYVGQVSGLTIRQYFAAMAQTANVEDYSQPMKEALTGIKANWKV